MDEWSTFVCELVCNLIVVVAHFVPSATCLLQSTKTVLDKRCIQILLLLLIILHMHLIVCTYYVHCLCMGGSEVVCTLSLPVPTTQTMNQVTRSLGIVTQWVRYYCEMKNKCNTYAFSTSKNTLLDERHHLLSEAFYYSSISFCVHNFALI